MENYRPVSLTSQVCKLFEAVIRDLFLVHHLESKQLITNSQHGFRQGRSCLAKQASKLILLASKTIHNDNYEIIQILCDAK